MQVPWDVNRYYETNEFCGQINMKNIAHYLILSNLINILKVPRNSSVNQPN